MVRPVFCLRFKVLHQVFQGWCGRGVWRDGTLDRVGDSRDGVLVSHRVHWNLYKRVTVVTERPREENLFE